MVQHSATRFCAIHQHDFFHFIVRAGKIGHTFILSHFRIQHPGFQRIRSIVTKSSRQGKAGTEELLAFKTESLLTLLFFYNYRSLLSLKITFYNSLIRNISYRITYCKIICIQRYQQSSFHLIRSLYTYQTYNCIVSLFCFFLFPVIITEICQCQFLVL